MTTDVSKLLVVAAVAKKTTLSEPQVRNLLNTGQLEEIRLAGNVFVHADVLEEFLQKHPRDRA